MLIIIQSVFVLSFSSQYGCVLRSAPTIYSMLSYVGLGPSFPSTEGNCGPLLSVKSIFGGGPILSPHIWLGNIQKASLLGE